jgi:sialic acid synthase SpsE/mannose-6-phosphate isomerase-like protein (cupin superfamily)
MREMIMVAIGRKPLFIFELANNHAGSVDLGLQIIREVHAVVAPFRDKFNLGFKFQYRHLDTFIHPDYKDRHDIKYVKRFLETRLDTNQFKRLKDEVSSLGYLSICTPFDEASVDLIEKHGYDIVKIASCSLTDWPLLERIAQTSKPVIGSTAGVPIENVDQVVSFFKHRHKQFALLHCVAEYPTENNHLELNQIDLLKGRYQDVTVGFSTHEAPGNVQTVRMAAAKGAMIFERHVGVATDKVKLNEYSANPAQVGEWLEAAADAFDMCGVKGQRCPFGEKELSSLAALRRGAFAKRPIRKGERIQPIDLCLAIPTIGGQVTANDLSKYTLFTASVDITEAQPVMFKDLECLEIRGKVEEILDRVKALLRQSQVVVPQQADIDISHHYGIDRFYEKGCTILNFLNREYCKKLIAILPGQSHPEQYHLKKEETFIVLYGDVEIVLDGVAQACKRGDIITVERGVKHVFSSRGGAVIEEISSTHFKDDSYYTDEDIGANTNRKTQLTYWLD